VYRIAQEALHNAGRHAGAGQLELALQIRAGQLLLAIADDGRGFLAPERLEEGEGGLGEMASRAASVGGALELRSLPGVGTQVRACLPFSGAVLRAKGATGAAGRRFESLTSRERQVLAYAARGMTNKQIAAAIGISDRTVQFHLGNVLSKLDAASRTEAAVIALSEGLI
jgi:DNA-binding CsgD family transcriptional regulator